MLNEEENACLNTDTTSKVIRSVWNADKLFPSTHLNTPHDPDSQTRISLPFIHQHSCAHVRQEMTDSGTAVPVPKAGANKRSRDPPGEIKKRDAVQELVFRWLLRRIASHPVLSTVKFEPDAWKQLQLVCDQNFQSLVADGSSARSLDSSSLEKDEMQAKEDDFYYTTVEEKSSTSVLWENNVELKHHIARLAASLYSAILSPPVHVVRTNVLVYKKCSGCRGSADAIRLLLNDQRIPYAEYHVEMESDRDRFRDAFASAKLPENWPYFSDGICEVSGSGSILRYLARKYDLAGRTDSEAAKVDAVIEFGFAVLQALWKSDCQCSERKLTSVKISRDRVRAKFIRDTLFPLLGHMNRLAPPDYRDGAEEGSSPTGYRDNKENGDDNNRSQEPPMKRWVFKVVIL